MKIINYFSLFYYSLNEIFHQIIYQLIACKLIIKEREIAFLCQAIYSRTIANCYLDFRYINLTKYRRFSSRWQFIVQFLERKCFSTRHVIGYEKDLRSFVIICKCRRVGCPANGNNGWTMVSRTYMTACWPLIFHRNFSSVKSTDSDVTRCHVDTLSS